jgi:hypothetical protein
MSQKGKGLNPKKNSKIDKPISLTLLEKLHEERKNGWSWPWPWLFSLHVSKRKRVKPKDKQKRMNFQPFQPFQPLYWQHIKKPQPPPKNPNPKKKLKGDYYIEVLLYRVVDLCFFWICVFWIDLLTWHWHLILEFKKVKKSFLFVYNSLILGN